MTNSRAVAYKNWIARCFPPRSRVLVEATDKLVKTFSIAFLLNLYYIFIIYDYLPKSKKKRTKSNKEGATSKEQRAKSNKHRAKSNKQRAKTNEQRAKNSASFLSHNEHFYTRYLFYLA